MTTKAAEKRYEFITSLFADSNARALDPTLAPMTEQDWADIVDAMAETGVRLGRTERWVAACTWAQEILAEMDEAAGNYKWAALQGSIYMSHAAE